MKQKDKFGVIPAVKQSYLIGKNQACDIWVPDSKIMQEQCCIEFNSVYGWVIHDKNFEKTVFKNQIFLANYRQWKDARPSNL
jgi:hypothetical protein